jgi:hypothetical protein
MNTSCFQSCWHKSYILFFLNIIIVYTANSVWVAKMGHTTAAAHVNTHVSTDQLQLTHGMHLMDAWQFKLDNRHLASTVVTLPKLHYQNKINELQAKDNFKKPFTPYAWYLSTAPILFAQIYYNFATWFTPYTQLI